ncbi:MAG: transglutaminase family protein [Chloroflexi bacterium]|nr:transglutaminase family protein [Chloroflexota bacterium]
MRVRVGCEFEYATDGPVPVLMLVRAHPDDEHRTVHETRWLDPNIALREYVDAFGNFCWRFTAPGGPLRVRYDAVVEISGEEDRVLPDAPLTPIDDVPNDALVYTLPSRYVESDLLITTAWELFGQTPPTWARVQAVCDWVHANVRYETGSSDPTVTAMDTFRRRVGVCRDFALLAVALCRALNIPARYTFGYLPDIAIEPPDVPMDFHAWFEAYVDGRWYPFDARHNVPRIGRVVIGRGRDAVDVALSTSYGALRLDRMTVWSDEVTADNPGGPPTVDDADLLEAGDVALEARRP